jgi:hypothetical protein
MIFRARMILVAAVALAATGCQSSQSRKEQLQAICADPVNRQPKSFYWSECQALYPSSPAQLDKDYVEGAPTGNR